ncbi:hypothetical protein [Paenibacillus antibioticophila]|nr:hypothetical protein [Paenibacillus antibioticophila]
MREGQELELLVVQYLEESWLKARRAEEQHHCPSVALGEIWR